MDLMYIRKILMDVQYIIVWFKLKKMKIIHNNILVYINKNIQ